MTRARHEAGKGHTQEALFRIIFRSDTPGGMLFDVALIVAILLSVIVVMLMTVDAYNSKYGQLFKLIEWGFTILFTIEYGLRLYCVRNRARYAKSFFGVVDLLSVLPTYLGLILTGTAPMMVIRILRILRLFRIMHMDRYVGEANILLEVLVASWRKTLVFVYTVLTLVVIFGALMHFVEGPEGGFTNMPQSMYWAIVTLTTVGFGDITPVTPLGKLIASMIMLTGYGIIAVPMGIYFSEFAAANKRRKNRQACPSCKLKGHEADAMHCRVCGTALETGQ
ncbi:MAG: ion transporter [Gammaproteobacteria bacterium]